MDREPVTGSSNITSVGFEDGVLEVEFRGGKVYRYEDIPAEVHENWKAAGFRGGHFHQKIRALYEGKRVGVARKVEPT